MRKDRFYTGLKRLDSLHRVALALPFLTPALRLGSYVAFRALEIVLGARHPHGRVVAQARALTRRPPGAARRPSRKVLFFTVRGWYPHLGTEAVLAKALELRGAETSFFLCGGTLEQCDFKPGTDPYVTRPLCWRCHGFATRLLDALGLRYCQLRDVVGADVPAKAKRIVGALDSAALRRFTYRDLPIFEFTHPSVLHSLLRGDVGEDARSERVLRGYLESAVVFTHACDELLRREQPDIVVMTNGLFFAERIMLEVARRAGLEVVTYERGIPLETVYFDRNRPVVLFDLDDLWAKSKDRALSSEENRALDGYLGARAGGQVGNVDLWPRMEKDQQALLARLELRPDAPLAVVFTNVLWDSSFFKSDGAFTGMFDWLATTIRLFRDLPDAQLVIRVHPAEVRVPMAESRDRVADRIRRQFPRLPPNVRVVPPEDPTSSYTLLELARLVLVYASTIGLEAAVRGKPVVVAGHVHYRGRGWTMDVERKEDYGRQVVEALTRPATLEPEQLELARRYAHLFFFRFMQPFPWLIDTPRSERRLAFGDLAELAAGRHAVLDRICAGILDGSPFVSMD